MADIISSKDRIMDEAEFYVVSVGDAVLLLKPARVVEYRVEHGLGAVDRLSGDEVDLDREGTVFILKVHDYES